MNAWKSLKQTKNFLKLLSMTSFAALLFMSFLMVQYLNKNQEQVKSISQSQSHLELAISQLSALGQDQLPSTHYLETIEDLYLAPHKQVAKALNTIQPKANALIQQDYQMRLEQVQLEQQITNIMQQSLQQENNFTFQSKLYQFSNSLHSFILGQDIQESALASANSRIESLESYLQEDFISESTSFALGNLLVSTQNYIDNSAAFSKAKTNTLELLTATQENLKTAEVAYAAESQSLTTMMQGIMAMLFLCIGWVLYTTYKNRHYETMVSDNLESAKVSEIQLLQEEVETLLDSVDEAWIDSYRESEVLHNTAEASKDFNVQMETLENDITYVKEQEIVALEDLRKRMLHLFDTKGMVSSRELSPLIDLLTKIENEVEGNRDYVQKDMETLENGMTSVCLSLKKLEEQMAKVMSDTTKLHETHEKIDESRSFFERG